MLEVFPAPEELSGIEEPEVFTRNYGTPCAFSGCSGFFHPAKGATGVILCAPWGYEELTTRKSWRLLAETIAAAGYPCLRFDYPGTGNSAGAATEIGAIKDWIEATDAAVEYVRGNAGVRRFVLIGQSLGATLAVEAARERDDVVGLYLITPVVEGQAYARELAAMSKRLAGKLGITPHRSAADALNVVGFALSNAMAESLKTIDLRAVDRLGVDSVVVYDRMDQRISAQAVEQMRRVGARVSVEKVKPRAPMVSDATISQPLPVATERLLAKLVDLHPVWPAQQPAPARMLPSVISAGGFREQPIRFGADASLFGVLCRPPHDVEGTPAVVLLNCGLAPHVGWGRGAVDRARGLAAAGISSLRIDVAGIGESADVAGRSPHLIYSDFIVPDVMAAVDVLLAHGHRRIMLAGVGSGAYMALATAQADPRVTDVIAVNAQRFIWNPADGLEDVRVFGPISMTYYGKDRRSRNVLKRLIRRRKQIAPSLLLRAKRSLRSAKAQVPLRLRAFLRDPMLARVERLFASFVARGTRISLIYTAGDPGLVELRTYFGPSDMARRNPNVTVSILPDADHHLTTVTASHWLTNHMVDLARDGTARREDARPVHHAYAPRRAICPT